MEELSDTDIDFGELIPKEIVDKGGQAIDELLPDKSKKRYEEEYSSFEKWMDRNRVKIVEEVVLLAYFQVTRDESKQVRFHDSRKVKLPLSKSPADCYCLLSSCVTLV